MNAVQRAGMLLGLVGTATAYQCVARPRLRSWGATAAEVTRAMPGDDIVGAPEWSMTFGITVQAPPAAIWPWLAQLGYQRGGLYSYDWLDRLFGILDRPSADEVLPHYQHLEAGDVIPIGAGPSWPVAAVEPNRWLVLAPVVPGRRVCWAFALYPIDADATRLVTRAQLAPANPAVGLLAEPPSFLMTRKMLLNLKARAERLAAGSGHELSSLETR
jgi:hypothetical protein